MSGMELVFSPDNLTLVSGGSDGTVRLWQTATGTSIATLDAHTSSVSALTFSPDGSVLASAGNYQIKDDYYNGLRLWDAKTGKSLSNLTGHSQAVTEMLFSPDGSLIASASADGTVWLWGVKAPPA